MKLHYLNKRDYCERQKFIKTEYIYLIFKSIYFDKRVDFKTRFLLRGRFFYYKYSYNKLKVRNRCIITGRSRFVLRYSKMSRMTFRDFVSQGKLCGFKKY